MKTFTRYTPLSSLRFVCIELVICLLLATSSLPAPAADSYEPLLESLQIRQKQSAQQAAPNGMDSEEQTERIDVSFNVASAPIITDEPSQLAAQIEEKLEGVSLNQRQQTQALEEPLQQFGYDALAKMPSAEKSLENVPVPLGYRVGSGDTLVVQIYGKRNVEYRLVVTREGQLLIPEFGPVQVAGLSFGETSELISTNFSERVIGAKAVVTMAAVRNIQIRVTGDVRYPGTINVSGLSTMIDVLLTSGGIKYSGSLRKIHLRRAGRTVGLLDLYTLLLKGNSVNDFRLRPNDVIFVPPIGDVVAVGGDVQRPGIYEINKEKTVDDAIQLAGGLLASASLKHSHVERIVSGKYRTLVNPWDADISSVERAKHKRLSAGDFIRVLSMDEKLDGVVLLEGHVKRPGGYEYKAGMRFADLIGHYSDFAPGADHKFALINRELGETGRSEILYVDIDKAFSTPGGSHDLALQSRDRVKIFSVKESRAEQLSDMVRTLRAESIDQSLASVFSIRGHSRYTGEFPLQQNTRLLDALRIGGGVMSGADVTYGLIARTEHFTKRVKILSFSLSEAIDKPSSSKNPVIQLGDRIYLFDSKTNRPGLLSNELDRLAEQANYVQKAQTVRINGRVKNAGVYPLVNGMRLSDLLCAADGLDRKGFGIQAELSRIEFTGAEKKSIQHLTIDAGTLIKLCTAQKTLHQSIYLFRKNGHHGYNAEPNSVTADIDQWRLEYNDEALNLTLLPGDELTFTEKPGWSDSARVFLSGEVVRPGTYVIERGETLCQVLNRASGLSVDAYAFGAEFTRLSVKRIQQETLDSIQNQLDDLLVELSLSHSARNSEKTPAGNSKDEYIKIIRQLERAKPSGRMVVDVKGASKCKKSADIVLEDGDKLHVPREPNQVYVSGQVYVPTSHMYRKDRKAKDYIDMSGGATVLGRIKDAYVMQANGEVVSVKRGRKSSKVLKMRVGPGARIIVPLNVDRMNTTERAQSWTKVFLETAILAGVIL